MSKAIYIHETSVVSQPDDETAIAVIIHGLPVDGLAILGSAEAVSFALEELQETGKALPELHVQPVADDWWLAIVKQGN